MNLPIKIVLPLLSASVGLAIAIPLAASSVNNSVVSNDIVTSELKKSNLELSFISPSSSNDGGEMEAKTLVNKIGKCKLIVWETGQGKLEMCLKGEINPKIEFTFYQEIVASSIPVKVKLLEFTYKDLVLELEEEIEDSNTRRFLLPHSLYGNSGEIVVNRINNSKLKFNEDNCEVEWINSKDNKKINWRAKCISISN